MDNNQPTTTIATVLAEMRIPMNTGLIARSKLQHLRDVLVAWPDVTIFGKPLVQG